MPINYSDYPPNWKTEIRPAILERAGNRCERCKVPNKAAIIRGKQGEHHVYMNTDLEVFCAETGGFMGYASTVDATWAEKNTTVVLTIAHLDHDKTNNDFSNLKALCQRCHLAHDKNHHAANRKATLAKRKGMNDLFSNK